MFQTQAGKWGRNTGMALMIPDLSKCKLGQAGPDYKEIYMNNISVIGVHTPEQKDALQAATGMEVRIRGNSAYLAEKGFSAHLLDAYDQTDRDSWLGNPGESKGVAA